MDSDYDDEPQLRRVRFGPFADAQARLKERLTAGQAAHVYLGFDTLKDDWCMVVVEAPTGVIYGHQCAGTSTDQRYVEGYLVPIQHIDLASFRAVFHRGGGCAWLSGPELSEKRLATLEALIASISCQDVFGLDFRTAGQLRLDREH